MPLPPPSPGLVISYAYLWRHEARAGREEGVKDRPCVVIVAVERPDDRTILVRVAPITHRRPDDALIAVELPAAVKRHLGLDEAPSWVIANELNEFSWPGFDVRPLPPPRGGFSYGFLPPRLFAEIVSQIRQVWRAGLGRKTDRD